MQSPMDVPIKIPWWRRKAILLMSLAAVLLLAWTFSHLFAGPAHRSVRVKNADLRIVEVENGVYRDLITIRSTVTPKDIIYISSTEGGTVSRLLVQSGDRVEPGQPLIELRNDQLEISVQQQKSQTMQSITQMEQQEAQLEQTRVNNLRLVAQADYEISTLKRQIERFQLLFEKSHVPKEDLDSLVERLKLQQTLLHLQEETNERQEALMRRQLPEIHAKLRMLQGDLTTADKKLENLTVRAPVAGIVTTLELKVGQATNRAEPLAQLASDTGNMLSAPIEEYYLKRVLVGQIARVRQGSVEHLARVSRVHPQVKDGTFMVDLIFDGEEPPGLLQGQTLLADLYLGGDEQALIMPPGPFLERTAGTWIFVVGEDGHSATRRSIEIGRRSSGQLEILSGLEQGERVIISDYVGLERFDQIVISQ